MTARSLQFKQPDGSEYISSNHYYNMQLWCKNPILFYLGVKATFWQYKLQTEAQKFLLLKSDITFKFTLNSKCTK